MNFEFNLSFGRGKSDNFYDSAVIKYDLVSCVKREQKFIRLDTMDALNSLG